MRNMKTWLQLGSAVVMAVWAALTDSASADNITNAEWVVIASMALGAFGVYVVPNMDESVGRVAKGIVSFLTAALPALSLSLSGGLTQTEMVAAIITGLAAVGLVTGVGNKGYVFKTERPVNATNPM